MANMFICFLDPLQAYLYIIPSIPPMWKKKYCSGAEFEKSFILKVTALNCLVMCQIPRKKYLSLYHALNLVGT